eukprot:CAMPEP_0202849228 /NCGR_PEP_ID=MMETSP1389-20130828/80099_1 /ASSEMBLY_ACC=CAM_ASM_000865 /TAXON_ID=302021 /ORGANISM="Rhodomonas sp., Strain CCMP768" /LENGTH=49 /DNA_ID= /DNA_START= /DNA_END= /DNA_ORIENTATION=
MVLEERGCRRCLAWGWFGDAEEREVHFGTRRAKKHFLALVVSLLIHSQL